MNVEEDSTYSAIVSAKGKILHVHASENNRGIPGNGQINWLRIKEALSNTSYNGAIGIESFTPLVKTFATQNHSWRRLARSQDKIASDGLKFLKNELDL